MANTKTLFLNDNDENETIELDEFVDSDGNNSVKLWIDVNGKDEYVDFGLHRNALKVLIQRLTEYL